MQGFNIVLKSKLSIEVNTQITLTRKKNIKHFVKYYLQYYFMV